MAGLFGEAKGISRRYSGGVNTREARRFGDLKLALPSTLEEYLAGYPEPVLVVEPFDDTPPRIPYETPASYSLARAAKAERRFAPSARVHWLNGQVISVGRTSDNDVVFDHFSVSKVHAALREQGDHCWEIEDTHSTNGTIVNGLQLEPLVSRKLEPGDWIFFAEVRARFLSAELFWEILQEN